MPYPCYLCRDGVHVKHHRQDCYKVGCQEQEPQRNRDLGMHRRMDVLENMTQHAWLPNDPACMAAQ